VSKDITSILDGWPHEPGQINVRKVRGDDGTVKLQLRVDLGVLQMESQGRPDGQKPFGFESVAHYLEDLLGRHRRTHHSEEGFTIDPAQCEMLRAEAVQYYYRYLGEFALEDYEGVERDTARNLRVADLCRRHARDRQDRSAMEQYRPYILMMNTQARAQLLIRGGQLPAAREAVVEAMETISRLYKRQGIAHPEGHSSELIALQGLLRDIDSKIPVDPVDQLKGQLATALAEERYEDAAKIRDRIAKAGGNPQE
jgi:hypothetical protein